MLYNLNIQILNSDFSLDIESSKTKLSSDVLYSLLEWTVSQNVDLGPGSLFML